MSAASVQIIPKGLHHLEVTHKSKFFGKWPSRLPHPPHQFVQPSNRIRRWNVRPEDKVRLLVGKPGDKYIDETRGARSGWRVYTVKSVDMERNKVYLEGISNKKSSTARPRPDNFNSLSDDERKKWETESNIAPMSRPVHYSNVQLCVEDKNGPDSVFASRLATSTPYFNKGMRRLEWDRYAAKLSGTSDQVPDPERGLVRIPWPERKKEEMPPPSSALDTPDPSTSSLQLPSTSSLLSTRFGPLLPSSPRSPIPNNPESRLWADAHLLTPGPEIDASMPLFLSEELSPRFSRAKKTAGFNARREALAIEREEAARIAVEEWEAGGRDAALTEILGREGAESLEGVHIRGRTRAEVRDAALANWDAEQERTRRGVKEARRLGKTWDTELGEWVDGEQGIQREKKKERKERKEGKMLKRMEGLRLEQGRNTVVPPSVRA